jgi:hypothetical protein
VTICLSSTRFGLLEAEIDVLAIAAKHSRVTALIYT